MFNKYNIFGYKAFSSSSQFVSCGSLINIIDNSSKRTKNISYKDCFENNELLVWLPSIVWDGTTDNSINMTYDNDFRDNLKCVIEDLILDERFVYEFKYSMFFHTNDNNKDVVSYIAYDSGIEADINDDDSPPLATRK